MDFSIAKKNLAWGLIVLGLALSGCTKKTETSDKTAKVAQVSQIPVLNEEVEDFFDNEAISEFAFVEDGEKGDAKNSFELEAEKDDSQIAENVDEDFLSEGEEDAFFAWEDDESSVKEESEFKTVYFDLNKNSIRKDQKEALNNNIERIKKVVDDGKEVVVYGNTCQLGAPSYNLPLSERRANAIKQEMVDNGIPAEKIKAIGVGSEAPVVWSDKVDRKGMIDDLAPNRRAEFSIV